MTTWTIKGVDYSINDISSSIIIDNIKRVFLSYLTYIYNLQTGNNIVDVHSWDEVEPYIQEATGEMQKCEIWIEGSLELSKRSLNSNTLLRMCVLFSEEAIKHPKYSLGMFKPKRR